MIARQIRLFLMVGSLTALVDFITYRGLVGAQLLSVDSAKAAGFLIGTVCAYFANQRWTFERRVHGHQRLLRFIALYTISLMVNIYVNALLLGVLQAMGNAVLAVSIAFVIATGVSACMNFIGMKFFVFADRAR